MKKHRLDILPLSPDGEAFFVNEPWLIDTSITKLNIPSEMVLSDRADGACRPQKWCSAAVCMVHSYGFR